MKTTAPSVLLVISLVCFAALPAMQAVSPPPDGDYPNGNTAEGFQALYSLEIYSRNDTAIGHQALYNTTRGNQNTAVGSNALFRNTTGNNNTVVGYYTLFSNTTGIDNTAVGNIALHSNNNTVVGANTLFRNTTGINNTACGVSALHNSTGDGNVALGVDAGSALTTGNNNIDIGYGVKGQTGENNTIRIGNTDITDTIIRGIFGTGSGGAAVFVNNNGKLGTLTSSQRFKDEIKPMGDTSDVILGLKPVSFRYKKDIDPEGIRRFGLIAEDVEKVNPDLVVHDKEGKPQTVRYEQINAMLLNEFLKEHKTGQEQGAIIAKQQKQIEALTAGLQKVSAQLEVIKSVPQTVLNNQ
jgi:hypothetical protein